jgi:hypothetical protein
MRRSRKPLCVLLAYREFESLPLRFELGRQISHGCRGSGRCELNSAVSARPQEDARNRLSGTSTGAQLARKRRGWLRVCRARRCGPASSACCASACFDRPPPAMSQTWFRGALRQTSMAHTGPLMNSWVMGATGVKPAFVTPGSRSRFGCSVLLLAQRCAEESALGRRFRLQRAFRRGLCSDRVRSLENRVGRAGASTPTRPSTEGTTPLRRHDEP